MFSFKFLKMSTEINFLVDVSQVRFIKQIIQNKESDK